MRSAEREGVPMEVRRQFVAETDSKTKAKLMSELLVAELRGKDFREAADWLSRNQSESLKAEVLEGIALESLYENPEETLKMINGLEEDLRDQLVPAILRKGLNADVPIKAIMESATLWLGDEGDKANNVNDSKTAKDGLAEELARSIVQITGDATLVDSIINEIHDSDRKNVMIEAAAKQLSKVDPYILSEWMADLDPDIPSYSSAVRCLVEAMPDDPERSVYWALRVKDNAIRDELLRKTFRLWMQMDSEGIADVLRSGLDAETSEALLRAYVH